jgi:hypothetical protein
MAKLRSIAFNVPLAIFVIFSLFLFYFYLPGIYKAQSSNNVLVEEARKDVFLVAMVVSDAKEAADRQLIRDSWFKFRDNRYVHYFRNIYIMQHIYEMNICILCFPKNILNIAYKAEDCTSN